MKGEGKTFTSYNLSLSYSLTGKKVLLVGADLRNPQLHSLFGLKKNIKGLTDLIVKKDDLKPSGVIRKLNPQSHTLDVLFSGAIPPNPAELLDGDGFSDVLNSLKASYDVIIIDSAPLLPVSDTLGVLKHSDSVIFTLFAHKTDQSLTKFISSTIEEKNINKPCVVLNGIKSGPVSYYKYGYGYRYAYNYKYNYGYGYNYSEDN
jgi:capsular exopolysaccharide synthesis family protein